MVTNLCQVSVCVSVSLHEWCPDGPPSVQYPVPPYVIYAVANTIHGLLETGKISEARGLQSSNESRKT